MTEAEFEIIDALYFTLTFEQLEKELNWDKELIKNELIELIRKGWVKALEKGSEDEVEDLSQWNNHYLRYLYLATKEGLMAHNSRQ